MRGGKREGSGRKQGSSNKYNLRELFDDNNFDVGATIIEMLQSESTDKRTKLELIKLIFPYVFRKPLSYNPNEFDIRQIPNLPDLIIKTNEL